MDENGKAEMNEMSVGARPDGVRLQKVLAQAGVASRRAAEELIAAGRVSVEITVRGRAARLAQRSGRWRAMRLGASSPTTRVR